MIISHLYQCFFPRNKQVGTGTVESSGSRLYEYVEYKTAEFGIRTKQVEPAYTSHRCSKIHKPARISYWETLPAAWMNDQLSHPALLNIRYRTHVIKITKYKW